MNDTNEQVAVATILTMVAKKEKVPK